MTSTQRRQIIKLLKDRHATNGYAIFQDFCDLFKCDALAAAIANYLDHLRQTRVQFACVGHERRYRWIG